MAKKDKKSKKQLAKEQEAKRKESVKREIIQLYLSIVKNKNMFPTRADMDEVGISRDKIRHHFVNMTKLREAAKIHNPRAFSGILDIEDYSDSDILEEKLSKYKRFFITTAVSGQWAHKKFMKSIESYCSKKKAKLILLPSHDPAHNLDNEIEWHFDKILKDKIFIFDDFALNTNFHISGIRVTAKQMNPSTGLDRMCRGKGSFIFASPKQTFEPDPADAGKFPHVRMSPGACTVANYKTTKGNSLRTATLAEHDHQLGGFIVEIENDEIYHVRPVQADENGAFIDLGVMYYGNRTKKVETSLIMGDIHPEEHDEPSVKAIEEMIKEMNIVRVFSHDTFGGSSINHHEENNIISKAVRAKEDRISLEKEFVIVSDMIDRIAKYKSVKEYIIVRSNHDDFIDKWLSSGSFMRDPLNFQLGCKLADSAIDGHNTFKKGLEIVKKPKHYGKVVWLKRDESYKVGDIECGAHGDKGPNGSRAGSKRSLERGYGKCMVGHSHTPGIFRSVFQVGTNSILRPVYNVGPSSWMHCDGLAYPNGQRQLIIKINGKWRLKEY